jgi:hypothetical protein
MSKETDDVEVSPISYSGFVYRRNKACNAQIYVMLLGVTSFFLSDYI